MLPLQTKRFKAEDRRSNRSDDFWFWLRGKFKKDEDGMVQFFFLFLVHQQERNRKGGGNQSY